MPDLPVCLTSVAVYRLMGTHTIRQHDSTTARVDSTRTNNGQHRKNAVQKRNETAEKNAVQKAQERRNAVRIPLPRAGSARFICKAQRGKISDDQLGSVLLDAAALGNG